MGKHIGKSKKKIEEQSNIGVQTSHFYNDKTQTSSSVSNGTTETTGPMDENNYWC